MKLLILAAGRAGQSPEALLAGDYLKRLRGIGKKIGISAVAVVEMDERKAKDGVLAKAQGALIALDERGNDMTSADFARFLQTELQSGAAALTFVIGGAGGLREDVFKRAKRRIAFGCQTWPHLMVRAMLAEQLYRAATILTNHPYHRA